MTVYWARIVWGLFLAALVGFAFRRSWNWEHGKVRWPHKESMQERGRDTVVWVSPLIMPYLLGIYPAVLCLYDGIEAGLLRFGGLLADVLLICSLFYVLLLLLLPFLRRYFSARACATMWLLPVFLLYQAHMLINYGTLPRFILRIPEGLLHFFFYLWVAGFIGVFAFQIIKHARFFRGIMQSAVPVIDEGILAIWNGELEAAEYKKPIRLLQSPAAAAPFSMGRRDKTRVTVLPMGEFSPEALRLIFRHEIRHIQRLDVDTKIFLAFCGALCWFNPLVWIALRKASADLELSCDEIVLENENEAVRRRYAELLLDTAGAHRQGFTTCLSASAKALRYRLKNIMEGRARFLGTLLLSATMFCCVLGFGVTALAIESGTLGEAVLHEGCTVRTVYTTETGERVLSPEGKERLLAYVASIPIDKLLSANKIDPEILAPPSLDAVLNLPDGGAVLLRLNDDCIHVQNIYKNKGISKARAGIYIPRAGIDWNEIVLCLESAG